MTDYFALLDQPRAAWLNLEELKHAFHAKARRAHPDAQDGQTVNHETAFTELNEAYQVLREPKRRLQHLLTLSGEQPVGRSDAIPHDIAELFAAVAALTRQADTVLQKLATATNALSSSLLRPELLRTRDDIEQMLQSLQRLHEAAEEELRQTNDESTARLQQLYLRFSYLSRWITTLQEKQTRLAA